MRVDERIAENPLQGRPAKRQSGADGAGDEHARQAHQFDDPPGRFLDPAASRPNAEPAEHQGADVRQADREATRDERGHHGRGQKRQKSCRDGDRPR